MPRAVVFDLDYTLAVPDRDRATILEEASRKAGGPILSRSAYLEAHRRNLTRETREPIFANLLEGRETDADPGTVARAYRETIADALEALPGVEAMLADLRGTYRVGLLTNGPVRAQRDKLDTLGWAGVFDAAVVTGELEAGKPDRRAFEAVLGELEVGPHEAVYVGDELEADITGATAVGMRAIQVLRTGGPDPDPRASAHLEAETLAEELPAVVADLEAGRQ